MTITHMLPPLTADQAPFSHLKAPTSNPCTTFMCCTRKMTSQQFYLAELLAAKTLQLMYPLDFQKVLGGLQFFGCTQVHIGGFAPTVNPEFVTPLPPPVKNSCECPFKNLNELAEIFLFQTGLAVI